jgi:hypothetical protein
MKVDETNAQIQNYQLCAKKMRRRNKDEFSPASDRCGAYSVTIIDVMCEECGYAGIDEVFPTDECV